MPYYMFSRANPDGVSQNKSMHLGAWTEFEPGFGGISPPLVLRGFMSRICKQSAVSQGIPPLWKSGHPKKENNALESLDFPISYRPESTDFFRLMGFFKHMECLQRCIFMNLTSNIVNIQQYSFCMAFYRSQHQLRQQNLKTKPTPHANRGSFLVGAISSPGPSIQQHDSGHIAIRGCIAATTLHCPAAFPTSYQAQKKAKSPKELSSRSE